MLRSELACKTDWPIEEAHEANCTVGLVCISKSRGGTTISKRREPPSAKVSAACGPKGRVVGAILQDVAVVAFVVMGYMSAYDLTFN